MAKKVAAANGFDNWQTALISELDRESFRQVLMNEGKSKPTIKSYLHIFDQLTKHAGNNGAGNKAVLRAKPNLLLKAAWDVVEKASGNVVVNLLAGYCTAREIAPEQVNGDYLCSFGKQYGVSQTQVAKYWNDLVARGFVKGEFTPKERKFCFRQLRFEDIGSASQTFIDEWKKIEAATGELVSGKRNPKCTGAGAVTLLYRKEILQRLLWWYLNVELSELERKELIDNGSFNLPALLEVGKEMHDHIEHFIQYGQINKLEYRTLWNYGSAIYAILHNFYNDPATDVMSILIQLKSKFSIWEIPQRYQSKMNQVSLEMIYAALMDLKTMRRNAKAKTEKAKEDMEKSKRQLQEASDDGEKLRIQNEVARKEKLFAKLQLKEAKTCRDELLFGLLACHLLRERTLVDLRIGGYESNFELVKAEDGTEVWDMVLYTYDHKTKKTSKRFELNQLVRDTHEAWITTYRPMFANQLSGLSYFVRDDGNPFNEGAIYRHTVRITKRMLGVAINPHLFRDLICTKMVKKDERFLIAISKMLLHRSFDFTARKYLRYDEKFASQRINAIWMGLGKTK